MTFADSVQAWHDAGCFVLPVKADGSKAPAVQRWDPEDTSGQPDWAALFAEADTDGVGLVCGSPSGHLEMLEAEGRAVADGLVPQLAQHMADNGLAELWARVSTGYWERTPSGGYHWLLRTPGPAERNVKLARRPGQRDGRPTVDVLFETRGQGGFVVVAPSRGRTHATGVAWETLTGCPSSIPKLSVDERDALYAVVRLLDAMPEAAPVTERAPASTGGELRPGDDFNARQSWQDILGPLGWVAVRRMGSGIAWRREGKTEGISATTGTRDGDNLYVFSSSTIFDTDRPYSKFGAYALIEHHGDHAAAARELRRTGFGAERSHGDDFAGIYVAPPPFTDGAPVARAESQVTTTLSDGSVTSAERSSWWPRDPSGVLAPGSDEDDRPTLLARTDGALLLYPGRVNGLIGESESGKTWIALLAACQALDAGRGVLWLDFEDSHRGFAQRMQLMGRSGDDVAAVDYVHPEEGWTLPAQSDVAELLTRPYGLIVLDGYNAAMTLLGLDLQSNTDATRFAQILLYRLAASGAVVLYVDHVPKNSDQRGKGGIGAQAKRAMTTGSALRVEVEAPFGRGMTGKLWVSVDKDRPGYVREVSSGASHAGKAILTSLPDGSVTVAINPPAPKADGPGTDEHVRPLMQAISMILARTPDGMSVREITKALGVAGIKFSKGDEKQAASKLVERGRVRVETGPRGALIHHHVRPYYLEDDLISEDSD